MDAYFATELGWSNRKPGEGHQFFIQWILRIYYYLGGVLPKIVVCNNRYYGSGGFLLLDFP